MWSPGCIALAKGLQDFDTLTELVAGGELENHLEEIAHSLKTNVVLKHLLMASPTCRFCDELDPAEQATVEMMNYYLALNRAHRKISIDEGLSFKLWPMILADKNTTTTATKRRGFSNNSSSGSSGKDLQADVWYHLLRRRPELVDSN